MKQISLLFFFVFQCILAQHTVQGTFLDSLPRVKSVALYKLIKGDSHYVKYVDLQKNTFTFPMEGLSSGNYRVLYKNAKTGYVDFIYNQENVVFNVNSRVGQKSVVYTNSRENQLLHAYNYSLISLQQKLDSVQMSFFKNTERNVNTYQKIRSKIEGAQSYYENLAKDDFCLSTIKASKRFNPILPYKLTKNYIEGVKNNFFKYVDFDDDRLKNSLFLKSKVFDYVFYLHQSDDKEQENQLFVTAINNVCNLIKDIDVKEYLLADLIGRFIKDENSTILPEVLSMYDKLPKEVQDDKMLKETRILSSTLLGVIPPNIRISKKETLYDLNNAEKYLIIFWSSTCSHCRAELPKVDRFLGERKDIQVISVGLEKKEDKQSWLNNIKFYPKWKNVISFGKWESKEAINYNVNETPSYFILNKEKHITAKPDSLKKLLEKLKK